MRLTVTEARKRWSEVLDRVERGEIVSVTRRGKVVATFVPAERAANAAPDDAAKTE
jgi:prevent-host-death family protein